MLFFFIITESLFFYQCQLVGFLWSQQVLSDLQDSSQYSARFQPSSSLNGPNFYSDFKLSLSPF